MTEIVSHNMVFTLRYYSSIKHNVYINCLNCSNGKTLMFGISYEHFFQTEYGHPKIDGIDMI